MAKKLISDEINEFLNDYAFDYMSQVLVDICPFLDLFLVDENDDWVMKEVKNEPQQVRMIRAVYLISKFSELHTGRLMSMKIKYKDLWLRMEKCDDITS